MFLWDKNRGLVGEEKWHAGLEMLHKRHVWLAVSIYLSNMAFRAFCKKNVRGERSAFIKTKKREAQTYVLSFSFWCGKRDLNPYGVNHTPLKRARLPVPPLPRVTHYRAQRIVLYTILLQMSRAFWKKVVEIQNYFCKSCHQRDFPLQKQRSR